MIKSGLRWWCPLLLLALSLMMFGCEGDDGDDGRDGADGLPGSALIDASTASNDALSELNVESEITGVTIASAPVINFRVQTSQGVPIIGIGDLWEESNRFVRFSLTKLVPGTNGDPDSWVAYTRDTTGDGSTAPDYDTGASLVDHGDGTYSFTLNTDVNAVTGVAYEPSLTHRVAGQIGSGDVELEPQNPVLDFVPAGGDVVNTRNIAVMDSCNECHDGLVFHGRRFKVEYCVNCHNPDLAEGEGNFSFMVHRIHSAGPFEVLEGGFVSEATYPQDLTNCRKCHNGEDAETAEGNNWQDLPNIAACSGCHSNPNLFDEPVDFATGANHLGGAQSDNSGCQGCHPAASIETAHVTPNATPNNPNLLEGQRNIAYEIIEVTVDGAGVSTVDFRITSDGQALDLTALPTDLATPARYPGFLLAWSEPQGGIDLPADFNNLGENGGQPMRVDIDELAPINDGATDPILGDLICSGGICTAVLDGAPFPAGATQRTIGLQGYFRQDIDGDGAYDVSLHTPSVTMTATGDDARREIVDSTKCASCHEWFEGHGGNRVIGFEGGVAICTMCHVPNLSSSGRSINPADAADTDPDTAGEQPSDATVALGTSDTSRWPENTNNRKDMIHGIHSSAHRSFDYEFVRGRNDGIYYNWGEVTFPAEDGTSNCLLCHAEDTYELPLSLDALPTTVRTTGVAADGDHLNESYNAVSLARNNVPNATDWVNSPTASTCFYCHDSNLAVAHIRQNGGLISIADPQLLDFTQRQEAEFVESCAICHGEGKSADLNVVHGLE